MATSDTYFIFTLLSNDTYSISAKDVNNMPSSVVLPSTYNGKSVTSIGDFAFRYCSNLTSVEIPNSVTSIGPSAFLNCTKLTNVYITDIAAWCNISFGSFYANPLYYGANLYLNNKLVTQLTIPNGVTSINAWAFYKYVGLTSLIISNSVTTIGGKAFYYCENLTNVIIGNSVTSIDQCAFTGCSSLKRVTIPDSVISIGSQAFEKCTNLTNVIIGNSVTSIDKYTFLDCSSLTSVIIGNSVISIGTDAFKNCSSLVNIVVPSSVMSIDQSFIGCNKLESITLPFVGKYSKAYSNIADSRSGYSFPTHFGSIFGAASYSENSSKVPSSLVSVTITGGQIISDYAFQGCSSIAKITLPDSVIQIGAYAFEDTAYYKNSSNWLEDILYIGKHLIKVKTNKLPPCVVKDGTLTIADKAFEKCSGIMSVVLPDSLQSVGISAFSEHGLAATLPVTISDPNNLVYIGYDAFRRTSCYDSSNWSKGVLYIGKHLVAVNSSTINSTYEVKAGTLTIASGAFKECSKIEQVTLPDSLKVIDDFAFAGSSLLKLILPSNSHLVRIGHGAFRECALNAPTLTIPNSVEEIGVAAFYNCKIEKLEIGRNVERIGVLAFYNSSNSYIKEVIFKNNVGWYYNNGYGGTYTQVPINSSLANTLRTDTGKYFTRTTYINDKFAFISCKDTQGNSIYSIKIRKGAKNSQNILLPASYNNKSLIIEDHGFADCENLIGVEIPSGVTSIKPNAFSGCSNLKYIIMFSETPPSLEASIPTTITAIYVPKSVVNTYKTASGWSNYANKIKSNNEYLSFALFNNKNKKHIAKSITELFATHFSFDENTGTLTISL